MKRIDKDLQENLKAVKPVDKFADIPGPRISLNGSTYAVASKYTEMKLEVLLANTKEPQKGVTAIKYLKEVLKRNNFPVFIEYDNPQEDKNIHLDMVKNGFTPEAAKCFIPLVFANKFINEHPEETRSAQLSKLLSQALERCNYLHSDTELEKEIILKIQKLTQDLAGKTKFKIYRLKGQAEFNNKFPESNFGKTIDCLEPMIKGLDMEENNIESDIRLLQIFWGKLRLPKIIKPILSTGENLTTEEIKLLVKSHNKSFLKAVTFIAASGYYYKNKDLEKARVNCTKAKDLLSQDLVHCGVDRNLVTKARENLRVLELKIKGEDLVL